MTPHRSAVSNWQPSGQLMSAVPVLSNANDERGAMFVATINRTFFSRLFAIVGAEYILRWLPRGTHRWTMFRKPGEIEALLRQGGIDVADRVGVAANPFARTLRQVGSTQVNYMMFCKRATAAS